MPSQVGVLHEARPTARVVTGVRFYPCMGAYVHGQDVVPREARAAICADVGPFPRVSTVVLDQVAALCEALPTARVVTDVRFLKSVDALVHDQVALLSEACITARVIACKGLLICMR